MRVSSNLPRMVPFRTCSPLSEGSMGGRWRCWAHVLRSVQAVLSGVYYPLKEHGVCTTEEYLAMAMECWYGIHKCGDRITSEHGFLGGCLPVDRCCYAVS